MLKGAQIICTGFPKWEGDYMKSTVLLLSELARENEVMYVDYPYTYLDLARGRQKNSGRLRLLELENGGQVHLLTLPPFVPANWINRPGSYDRVLQWNGRRARKSILAAAQQLNFQHPIVINAFNPALGNVLAGRLNEQLLVYYCYDEISAAPWISKHGTRHEAAFLSRADLTIVSSTHLQQTKSASSRDCQLVKNGVSLALFDRPGVIPAPIRREGYKGIIGYLGSIDERLDYDLLEAVIQGLPDYQFIFVGRINTEAGAERLSRLPQVQLLGPKPPKELAAYVAAFDLGLIPFVKNQLTAGIYPLKVNEYLASGKPVVATPFSDLSDFSGVIGIAGSATDFRATILKELSEDEPARRVQRKKLARQHSWQNRAARLGDLIREKIAAGHQMGKQTHKQGHKI